MKKDLISIIVPLYNYANYIEELIKSVVSQNYTEWELIIVDDCSTDNPIKVLQPFLSNEKIKYIKLDTNKGYATAKNEGIIRSKGEYIVVLDADDLLSVKSLYSRYYFLKNNTKFHWVHAKAYEFSKDKKKSCWKKRKFIKRFIQMKKTNNYKQVWNAIHAQTVMVKRSVYLKVGLYEESMRSMSDKEMWARIQYNVGIPGYLDAFVSYYRIHNNQMHRSKEKKCIVKFLKTKLNSCIKERSRGNLSTVRKLYE